MCNNKEIIKIATSTPLLLPIGMPFSFAMTSLDHQCSVLRWPLSLLRLEVTTSAGHLMTTAKCCPTVAPIIPLDLLLGCHCNILQWSSNVLRWLSPPVEAGSEASAGRCINGLRRSWQKRKAYLWEGGGE
eukprot:TRINITY_DN2090_c2_g1_i2.p4 TRINITY_DN2090_c2_g1~~TRINITY_DN2090_c2_g1_i2.p4  ORF type:complete len:130 (+),score=5.03 TRINITY_DN2090_c2_g1_i2:96-485(+)